MSIENTLKNLPDDPGIYIMRDISRHVLYVGKAKNLKNRVRSYFQKGAVHNAKTMALLNKVDSVEYLVVSTEMEALLLENNLIKEHKPPYNILLKDDKGYPYIRLDLSAPCPRLELVRRLKKDKAQYFGPFSGGGMARELIELCNDLFSLRSCEGAVRRGKQKPCLKYHLGRCMGPCQQAVQPSNYLAAAQAAAQFLNGKHGPIAEQLSLKMEQAAQRQDYERAAVLRDRIQRMAAVLARQSVILGASEHCDVLGLVSTEGYFALTHFFVRSGRIVGAAQMEGETGPQTTADILSQYLVRQSEKQLLPALFLVSELPGEPAVLEALLSQRRGGPVRIHKPERGKKRAAVALAEKNAAEKLQKSFLRLKVAENKREEGLAQLAAAAGLPTPPYRIECFDISHIQGTDTVASLVVLKNGVPEKKEYRRYTIKTVNQNNDFASMAEVISRRLRRFSEGEQPDLMVIDGGKGQLNAALEIRDNLGLSVPMIGLAKREEEIYLPGAGEPLALGRQNLAVQLLQTVRDEAHRFAITFFRSVHNKKGLLSVLNNIPGIGEARKKALYKAFGSVENIRQASLESLQAVQGMNAPAAQAVFSHFNRPGKESN